MAYMKLISISIASDDLELIVHQAAEEGRNHQNMRRVLLMRGLRVQSLALSIRNKLARPEDKAIVDQVVAEMMIGLRLPPQ